MEEAQKRIFLGCCCCTNDYNRFFKLVKDALLQFLFVRTIVVLAQAIATYAETSTGIYSLLVVVVVIIIIITMHIDHFLELTRAFKEQRSGWF